ncbi:MAG: Hsp20/alpha crystallin family protein [Acidobacteria bacterium]|nr:Hsp20/alpha crystallin family protein [Acidobacteriota bacterium]
MFSLIRHNPYREMANFEREADRLFNRFLGRMPRWWDEESQATVFEPSFNVFEDGDNVVVEAEVPGLKKDDLKLQLSDDRLTLRGEVRQESEKKERNYHLKEMRYGSFERSVRLPYDVVADKAQAELKDGVLRVTLPKSDQAKQKVRQIQVKAA